MSEKVKWALESMVPARPGLMALTVDRIARTSRKPMVEFWVLRRAPGGNTEIVPCRWSNEDRTIVCLSDADDFVCLIGIGETQEEIDALVLAHATAGSAPQA